MLPGVIDPQVHFREPDLEHKEDLFTASRACAQGSATSFLEMPKLESLRRLGVNRLVDHHYCERQNRLRPRKIK